MDLGEDLVEGVFLERVNRFLARVEVGGRDVGLEGVVAPVVHGVAEAHRVVQDQQVDAVHEKVIEQMRNDFNATIRG
mgnify:CR=1 FL=1